MMELSTKKDRAQYKAFLIDSIKKQCQNVTVQELPEIKATIVNYQISGTSKEVHYISERWSGGAGKPAERYYYTTQERRAAADAEFIDGCKRRQERRAAKSKSRELSGAAATAAAIRDELRKVFPNVKFAVRSKKFAGGDSVDIDYTDGPVTELVEFYTDKYQNSHSDYTGDYWDYTGIDPALGVPGAKFVMVQRDTSDGHRAELKKLYMQYEGQEPETYGHDSIYNFESSTPAIWPEKYQELKKQQDAKKAEIYAADIKREKENVERWNNNGPTDAEQKEEKQRQEERAKKIINLDAYRKKKDDAEQEEKARASIDETISNMSMDELDQLRAAAAAGDKEKAYLIIMRANTRQGLLN